MSGNTDLEFALSQESRNPKYRGRRHTRLTIEDAREIRRLHFEEGLTYVDLGARFKVSPRFTIYRVLSNRILNDGDPIRKPGRSKLTETDVRLMRQTYEDNKITYADLAERFGVHPDTVAKIIRRESWKEV